jgi:hypothetical protein
MQHGQWSAAVKMSGNWRGSHDRVQIQKLTSVFVVEIESDAIEWGEFVKEGGFGR